MTMNREMAIKWIERLENNPELKGVDRMRYVREGVEKMCCLGVLMDMQEDTAWHSWDNQDFGTNLYYYGREEEVLPPHYDNWDQVEEDRAFSPVGEKGLLAPLSGAKLQQLNDRNTTWGPVIGYIKRTLGLDEQFDTLEEAAEHG